MSFPIFRAQIDGYKVDCTALPVGKGFTTPEVSLSWAARHVQQSRYALQIVKCQDSCQTFKTNWISLFPERFLPFPGCHKNEKFGLETVEPKDYFQNQKSYKFALLYQRLFAKVKPHVFINYAIVPFDMYCLSLDGSFAKGICKKVWCVLAFSSRNDTSSKKPPQDHRCCWKQLRL